MILRAANFAAIKHSGQRRKHGDVPYINHPLGVAFNLVELGGIRDPATLAAAILHDTVEDTDTTPHELAEEFGAEIAGIVAEVTDDKTLGKAERKRRQVEHASSMSHPARLVKLADKLYNLRDLAVRPPASWCVERIRGYFCWAWFVVQAAGEVNAGLQAALDEVFAGSIEREGTAHSLLPTTEADRVELLASYYSQMNRLDD